MGNRCVIMGDKEGKHPEEAGWHGTAGRYADAIAVPGDPLADLGLLSDVPFVMLGGRVLKRPGADAPMSGPGPYFPA
jgi:hypothetical protein